MNKFRHIFLIILSIIIGGIVSLGQQIKSKPKEVLILHSMKEKRPWNLVYNKSFREELKKRSSIEVEIFTENLDLLQFNSEEYKDLLETALLFKYKNQNPDIIVVTQPNAVKFVYERNLFPNIPKILVVPSQKDFENLVNSTVITYVVDFEKKIKHALKLIPSTQNIFVVAGNSKIDNLTLEKFKKQSSKYMDVVSFNYLHNKSRNEILSEVKHLPEKSLVYYLSYTQDLDGRAYMAKDFSFDLAANCNRPVFCYLDLLTDKTGIMGGMVVSLKSTAKGTVDIIEKILQGTPIDNIPPSISDYSYTYDWQELKKWNIDVEKLPEQSVFYNVNYSFFELYKYEIFGGMIVFISYTILLLLLLYSNRNKRISENKLKNQNTEYELLNSKFKKQNEILIEEKERAEENEEKFRVLFEQAAVGVAQIETSTGRFIKSNKKYADIVGYTIEEFEKLDFMKITHPDDLREDLNNMDLLKKGKVHEFSMEKRYFHKNGNIVWVDLFVSPMRKRKGKFDFHIAVINDITERKEAEQALKKSEERERELADIVRTAPIAITYGYPDGGLEKCNAAYCELTGYSQTELEKIDWNITLTPEKWRKAEAEKLQELVVNKKSVVYEKEYIRKDGTIVPIELLVGAKFDNKGEAIYYIAFISDITERKKAEQKLKESEQKFRTSIDLSPIPIALANNKGEIIFHNKQFIQTYGYTIQDIPSFDVWFNTVYPDEEYRNYVMKDWSSAIEEALNSNLLTKTREYKITCKNGKEKLVAVSAFFGKDYAIGTFVDFTEQRNIENKLKEYANQLEEANSTKDKFLSIISHDLRSPFNSMLGFSDLLLRNFDIYPKEKSFEFLQLLSKSIQNTFELLNDLLMWSSSQTGKIELEPQSINLYGFADEIVRLNEVIASNKQIVIEMAIDKNIRVIADRNTINTVFRNLLSNAIKFSYPNSHVFVEAKQDDETPGFVKISIIDTGVGISETKIGELFKQYVSSTKGTNDEKGTGLGLVLCHDFVQRNGGEIGVESVPEQRTEFWFTLPLAEPQPKEKKRKMKKEYSIVIAEDEETNYLLMETLFKEILQLPCKLFHAKNGQEAVDICLDKRDIDVVFMDVNLPKMNGYLATEKIKSKLPDIVVIAQTSDMSKEIEEEAFAIGCDGFITKPINEESLRKELNKHMRIG